VIYLLAALGTVTMPVQTYYATRSVKQEYEML